MSLLCPKCSGKTKVMQTAGIFRRRKCTDCDKIITTKEMRIRFAKGSSPFALYQAVLRDDKSKSGSAVPETQDGQLRLAEET